MEGRGRPKGPGKSKLDAFRPEIESLLANSSTQKFVAERYHTTQANLLNWLKKTRHEGRQRQTGVITRLPTALETAKTGNAHNINPMVLFRLLFKCNLFRGTTVPRAVQHNPTKLPIAAPTITGTTVLGITMTVFRLEAALPSDLQYREFPGSRAAGRISVRQ